MELTNGSLQLDVEPSFDFYEITNSTPSDGAEWDDSSAAWRAFTEAEHVVSATAAVVGANSSDDLLDQFQPSTTTTVLLAAGADASSTAAVLSSSSSDLAYVSNVTPSYFDVTPSEWLVIVSSPPRISEFNLESDYLPLNLTNSTMETDCTVLSNGTALCWAAAANLSSTVTLLTPVANDTQQEEHPGTVVKEYWALVLILFPLFTVFGNVLVILSVYKERSLHTVTNYFIVSLAVADLLVAALVMPFAVYFLVNVDWELSPTLCDFYIAMDVACSTSSIFNLVAISIDRFIAVTQPIKYAKHRNNKRVWLTIAIVWLVSAAIGSPIVLGLNTSPNRNPTLCIFYNPDFIIYSSLSSFYIPCIIMVVLYYKIFKAIHERAKKSAANKRAMRQSAGDKARTDMVIENIAQTKRHQPFFDRNRKPFFRYKETVVTLCVPVDQDQPTANTESGSQDNDEEDRDIDEMALTNTVEPCHIIENERSAALLLTKLGEQTIGDHPTSSSSVAHLSPGGLICTNGNNHDVSCECSTTTEETTFLSGDSCSVGRTIAASRDVDSSPKVERRSVESRRSSQHHHHHHRGSKRNGSVDAVANNENNGGTWSNRGSERRPNSQPSSGGVSPSRAAGRKPRFHLTRHHKSSRKKKEKSAAKKERKATKTLAIVIGVFLACWVPFFTCNILDAICIKLGSEWHPGVTVFLLTTWLGYMNSFINPVIYTIFNPEFRKAFKKILCGG